MTQQNSNSTERKRLLASRPDFAPDFRAALQRAPIGTVRHMVKTLPKGKVPAPKPKATPTAAAQDPERAKWCREMDIKMGLVPQRLSCKREGNLLQAGLLDLPPTAAPAAPAAPRGTLPPRTPAAPAQRPTLPSVATRLSPHAAELDRRMGFNTGTPGITRTATSLTASAGTPNT